MVRKMRSLIGSIWGRLPAIIRAPLSGYALLLVGSTLTVLPLFGNLNWHPEIPWAFPATALLAFMFWWYAAGGGFPASTREARRRSARVGGKGGNIWFPALVSALLIVTTMVSFRLAMPSLWPVAPSQLPIDISSYPFVTVFGLLMSVALSAAVVEELAFRGYMQRPLEEAYGIVPAVIIVGFVFWLSHLNHGELTYTHLPFHLLASIFTGVLVFITRSLLPAMIAHFIGDAVLLPIYAFRWPSDLYELVAARPVYESAPGGMNLSFADRLSEIANVVTTTNLFEAGPNRNFVIVLAVFGLGFFLTVVSLVYLAGRCRRGRSGVAE